MPPQGPFPFSRNSYECLFSTAEIPLQIQRGFPAKVSDVRSTGTGLPTSSPGLQLSQGEKAVYQHTQPLACRAAALLTHTAPQLAQLSYRGNIFTVPNKKETNTPPSSCPLRGFIVHTEGFQTAHRSLTVREIPRQHLPPEELPLPHGNRTQHLSHRCAWPACEELRAAGHAPSHRPAKKPGVAGKAAASSSSPRTERQGKEALLSQSMLLPPPLLQLSPAEQESPVTHSFASQGCQHRAEPASRLLISKKKPLPSHLTRMRPPCIKESLTASQV